MYFWGLVFLIVTTVVWFFKKEEEPELEEGEEESVPLHTAYQQMLAIVKLPAILQAALVLLTARIGGIDTPPKHLPLSPLKQFVF
jgi:hypothetical protein